MTDQEVIPMAGRDISVRESTAEVTPPMLLQRALEKNLDLDKLEKFMDLDRQWRADQARDAYVEAMTGFKSEVIEIQKRGRADFTNSKGQRVQYGFPKLADAVEAVVPRLSLYGLSHSWTTTQEGEKITVTCTVRHRLGHSESTSLTAGPDSSGSKNAIQAISSTVSYLERYTFFALLGLAAGDQDDDGKGAGPAETISDEQAETITRLMEEAGTELQPFLTYYSIARIEDLPADTFQSAVKVLKRRVAAKSNG